MSKTRLVLSLVLGALGVVALAPSMASAQTDQVVHPNSACKWETDWTVRTGGGQAGYYHEGWQQVDDVSPWHLAICGIDRFNLTNTTGLRDLDVRLWAPTFGPPTEVHCEARSSRPDGSIVKLVSTSAEFNGPYRMDFGGALNQGVAYGAYTVACTMPKFVQLINILQREY